MGLSMVLGKGCIQLPDTNLPASLAFLRSMSVAIF